MSDLELARKALESSSPMKPATAPNALQGCEKSEKSEKSPLAMKQGCEKSEKSEKNTAAMYSQDDERFICNRIERDLGLPPGSLTLWEPIRSLPRPGL
jgi:hypothetical protein